jgi:uncharacterized protein (TIGR03083 family)
MVATATGMTLEEAHTRGFEAVREQSRRFTEYLSTLDPASLATPVPGLDWTVGETVAHVESVYLRYTVDLTRAASPAGVAAQNADDIARLGVDVERAIATIDEQVARLARIVDRVAPGQLLPFHSGQMTTLAGGWGNLLGELLAHGDDVARATGAPFAYPSEDTEILWRFAAPVLQGWLRPEAASVVESWRIEFAFGPVDFALDRGEMRWGDLPGEPPDHVLVVDDAAAFTLAFPYRRRAFTDETAALLASRFRDL